MEVINYLRPLKYQLMLESAMGYLRTKHIHKGVKSSNHLVFASKLIDSSPLSNELIDEGKVTFNWGRKYQVLEDSFTDGNPDFKNNVTVYTDGSLVKGKAGSGYLIDHWYEGEEVEGHFALGPNRSVFQAEIYAINKATEHLINNSTTGRKITIHVDSQAALLALSSHFINKECVRNTVDNLNKLGHQNIVNLCWIKSHAGFQGNERADKLAKAGANETKVYDSNRPRISKRVLKTEVKETVDGFWNAEYKALKTCRQTKLWLPDINRLKAEKIVKLNRQEHSLLTQLITGHCYLQRHQSLITPETDPTCHYCQENIEQTAYHLIAECPCFWQLRFEIFGTSVLHGAWSVDKVVKFLREVKLPDGSQLLGGWGNQIG
jgi:ribonuclease HI